MKIQFQNSSFCKLLWIQDFLERFAEEFLVGRSLITNFGLTLKAAQGKNLVVLWENLKTGQKHFHIKPVPKEISKAACKKLPLSKVFSDSSMQMLWKLSSLSAFAREGAFNCSSLWLQNSFANSKALLQLTFNFSRRLS